MLEVESKEYAMRKAPSGDERALEFRQCSWCAYDFATDEGERGCHHYDCPYLPEQLDVRCPTCLYNFFVDDGNPGCGDPPDCEFSRDIAPERVSLLSTWLEQQPGVHR